MSESTTEFELPATLAQADNLPSIPAVAMEVLQLAKDANAGIEDFASVIELDPALSTQLLKLSNSSLFSLGQEVITLPQATMVLGLKTVQLMSLSFSLASSLPKSGSCGSFEYSKYWKRCIVSAVAGRQLCKLLNIKATDEAFMCGLLSHIGQLVMVRCMPEQYEEVLLKAGERWPRADDEQSVLGYESTDVSYALLREWGLPSLICLSIGYQHKPKALPENTNESTRNLTWVMRVCNLAVQIICDEEKGDGLAKLTSVSTKLGVHPDHIERFLLNLEYGVRETADLLDIDIGATNYHEIVEEARTQMMQISLGNAVDLQRVERRASHLESENRELMVESTTDKLTGVANRAGFDKALAAQLESRTGEEIKNTLGLVILDVDHFKNFNDTHGHQAGDRVLAALGQVLQKVTRTSDYPARYGGEEFAVIVPHTTPFNLKGYAERLRRSVEELKIPYGEDLVLQVTISVGAACLARATDIELDATSLIEAADKQLYGCKERGRNCVGVQSTVLNLG